MGNPQEFPTRLKPLNVQRDDVTAGLKDGSRGTAWSGDSAERLDLEEKNDLSGETKSKTVKNRRDALELVNNKDGSWKSFIKTAELHIRIKDQFQSESFQKPLKENR